MNRPTLVHLGVYKNRIGTRYQVQRKHSLNDANKDFPFEALAPDPLLFMADGRYTPDGEGRPIGDLDLIEEVTEETDETIVSYDEAGNLYSFGFPREICNFFYIDLSSPMNENNLVLMTPEEVLRSSRDTNWKAWADSDQCVGAPTRKQVNEWMTKQEIQVLIYGNLFITQNQLDTFRAYYINCACDNGQTLVTTQSLQHFAEIGLLYKNRIGAYDFTKIGLEMIKQHTIKSL